MVVPFAAVGTVAVEIAEDCCRQNPAPQAAVEAERDQSLLLDRLAHLDLLVRLYRLLDHDRLGPVSHPGHHGNRLAETRWMC